MSDSNSPLRLRRALLSVSNKENITELALALQNAGVEIVATGRTAQVIQDAGIQTVPIEPLSGSPEAFQGRMKTLSFPVCSGILYRRGDAQDEQDLKKLQIQPIDCVVVNFYPFEKTVADAQEKGVHQPSEWVEQIDIGGPTLVRAAAKNAPDVLVLTDPNQYQEVISQLNDGGEISQQTACTFASQAWKHVLEYDQAIAAVYGPNPERKLRYGENPHQEAWIKVQPDSPIAWPTRPGQNLTPTELSYNNILDFSSAYELLNEIKAMDTRAQAVVIVKHNNPCGVAVIPQTLPGAQLVALERAWQGDPVSAFGGVIAFSHAIEESTAEWLSEKFVELVGAPQLEKESPVLEKMLKKRKKLKAVRIQFFQEETGRRVTTVPGAQVFQTPDTGLDEPLNCSTQKSWPEDKVSLARFGIAVGRSLKSNSIALVRNIPEIESGMQLVGAGQGQPNRVEALKALAVPRAHAVLREGGGSISDCVMVSDAFFPFRDTVDEAFAAGIRWIVQPGGSIKDKESIAACDEHGISMVLTGRRHFRH